jgi:class 3 adenylate cyclase
MFESTWPGQNWALTEWPVNVDSSRLVCAKKWTFRDGGGDVNRPVAALGAKASGFETRKLAAILAVDIVGFSRLTGADEDRTLASQPRATRAPDRSQ